MTNNYAQMQKEREAGTKNCPECNGAPFFTDLSFQASCDNQSCGMFARRFKLEAWNALPRRTDDSPR